MALITPPSWLQNGSYPAESDRLTTQALYNTTGVIGTTSMAVTQNSPVGMSVRVASGWAAIVGTTQANMGTYVAYNDATTVLTISAANPTNPRIDRVVATVRDAYYSGSDNDVIFQVIAGTPAASPSAPATPANSISLATIAVAANATQIVTANITDTRVSTSTGLIPRYVGQVVSTTIAAGTTTNSSTFVDVTGFSATITPRSTSSKILILCGYRNTVQGLMGANPGGTLLFANTQIARSTTNIGPVTQIGLFSSGLATQDLNIFYHIPLSFLDSPNTTSPVTYKIQVSNTGGTAVFTSVSNGTITLLEVIE